MNKLDYILGKYVDSLITIVKSRSTSTTSRLSPLTFKYAQNITGIQTNVPDRPGISIRAWRSRSDSRNHYAYVMKYDIDINSIVHNEHSEK